MKDPAVLIYFDKWIASTNGLKAIYRAWYFDLLIYNYDKGSIPNDIDEIAGICRVLPSEYDLFKQVVIQVLDQKFKLVNDRYINEVAIDVLRKRELFVDKRSKSGNIGVVIKLATTIKGFNIKHLDRLKKELFAMDLDDINKHKDKQVLEQVLKLYINVDVNEDVDININKDIVIIKEHKLNLFISEKFTKVSRLKKMTDSECDLLISKYPHDVIIETLGAMENKKDLLTKYSSCYLTLSGWLKRRKEDAEPEPQSKLKKNLSVLDSVLQTLNDRENTQDAIQ
jgi:hypothetical protein